MATQTPIVDYTNRDYSSLLGSLLDLAALKLPEWTDRSENDLGRLMVELFAYVGDLLFYYQDRIANEVFLATAVERKSVIDLLSLIGYTLATPAPASATLNIQAPNDPSQAGKPVQISVGAQFATQATPGKPAVVFIYLPVTNIPLVLPRDGSGGTVSAQITAINATQIVNEIIGTSTGANQAFQFLQSPVLLPCDPNSQDYLSVEVDPGSGFQLWSRRGTLLYSISTDPHYVARVDENDLSQVFFGDNVYGQIPPAGSKVRATYLIGGGQAGNVGPNTITVVKSGVNVPITVGNPNAASGGADRESIDHARLYAPQVFRSFNRAVTAADYAALAENVPGVARAVAVAPSWNYVDLYVVVSGGSDLTDDLRARLLQYFDTRRMVTTLVSVREPDFVEINLNVTIGVQPTFYRDDVKQRVTNALGSLFDIDQLEFGQIFYLSKIYEVAQDVTGVGFAQVIDFSAVDAASGAPLSPSGATGIIQLTSMQFPRQGTLTVTTTGGLA